MESRGLPQALGAGHGLPWLLVDTMEDRRGKARLQLEQHPPLAADDLEDARRPRERRESLERTLKVGLPDDGAELREGARARKVTSRKAHRSISLSPWRVAAFCGRRVAAAAVGAPAQASITRCANWPYG